MPNMNQLLNRYDPIKELPALDGKIIFVTGGKCNILYATVSSLNTIKELLVLEDSQSAISQDTIQNTSTSQAATPNKPNH